jgi:hypothetical protein
MKFAIKKTNMEGSPEYYDAGINMPATREGWGFCLVYNLFQFLYRGVQM